MLTLTDISRSFRIGDEEVHALRGVSLAIAAGEYVSIMGPSGSGKSTLLNILGLLDRPSCGTYELDGLDVTALTDEQQSDVRRRKIGFVFQFFHLVPRLTARENVELPLVLAGVAPAERKPRVERLLEEFGIAGRARHRPNELSGGERQRVAIARALVNDPPILICDEPTGNLDSVTGTQIMETLVDLNKRGRTIVMVTHDSSVASYADRTVTIRDGRAV